MSRPANPVTLPLADYAALGGHLGRVRAVADVLAEARPRGVVLPDGVAFPQA